MQTKTVTGAHGNKIQFGTFDHIDEPHIVVNDCDCQLRTIYYIGEVRELDDFEPVIIKSKAQVMRAWESGTVWF